MEQTSRVMHPLFREKIMSAEAAAAQIMPGTPRQLHLTAAYRF